MPYLPPDEPDIVVFHHPDLGIAVSGTAASRYIARLAETVGFRPDPVYGVPALPADLPPSQAARAVTEFARRVHDAGERVRIESSVPDAASPLPPPDLAPLAAALDAVTMAVDTTARPDQVRRLLDDLTGDTGPLQPLRELVTRIGERCEDYRPDPHHRAAAELYTAARLLHDVWTRVHAAARHLPDPQTPNRQPRAPAPTVGPVPPTTPPHTAGPPHR